MFHSFGWTFFPSVFRSVRHSFGQSVGHMVGQSGQLYSWFGGQNVARSVSQSVGLPVGSFVAIHSVVLCRSFIQSLGKTKCQSVSRPDVCSFGQSIVGSDGHSNGHSARRSFGRLARLLDG